MITSQLQAALTEEQKALLPLVHIGSIQRWSVGLELGLLHPGHDVSHKLYNAILVAMLNTNAPPGRPDSIIRLDVEIAVDQACIAMAGPR